jgi:hypothetical protein
VKRSKKPSKSQVLAEFTARNHKDLSTYEIQTRLAAHYGVIGDTEQSISQATAKLSALRTRLSQDQAIAAGFESILTARR